ncbi:MAG: serine/threonine protein kinase-like protein [Rhodocyclaceae bacterium]|nr:MAG: serine/threonine protein kinase-like protein [Rhodocyclaceae bacterium]TND04623.1 MAG: serine/threonine protein kinase-like protein [Rhodocyclaceae bacterium]
MKIHFDRTRLALLLLLAALLGVGIWAYRGVGDSLREIRATGMQTLLNTQVGTLEQWISERRHEAEQLAADPELSTGIRKLTAGRGNGAVIIAGILRKAAPIGVTGARVIDPRGRILAAKDEQRIGSDVTPDFFAHLSPVLAGDSAFVRPYRGSGAGEVGRAWVAAPIRANGRIVAVLALGSPVDKGFSGLFDAARPGLSGEAFAFDAEGWLLSPSRHAEEMRQRGLALRLALPDTEADRLTLLATRAVAARATGGEGLLLQPYPNYLGRDVIGAWRWLRDLDVGIAVEIEASEAYAPLTYLQIGFSIVLLLIFAVWLSGFLPPSVLAGLLRRDSTVRQLGPYRLLRQIGEGAISNVYLAQHRMLKRPAAVKVLKPQAASDEWTARFQREVQLSSLLHHPNTIRIYDYGTGPNGEFYYAMEYLEGLSLADLVERYGPVPPARSAYILRQACASLWEAHSCGLVHRDIKPQNIMLCEIRGERDVVKVLDFGLVKQMSGDNTRDLTGSMRILGTPLYMSPERIRNPSDADGRADIYALGAVGFFLLTGKRLFETETEHDLTYQVLHTVPRLASACSPFAVPAELDALIGRCLEKDPAARPQSIAEVAGMLDGVLVHMPWTRSQIDTWWKNHWVSEDDPGRRFTAPKS